MAIRPEEITSVLKDQIAGFSGGADIAEEGFVL